MILFLLLILAAIALLVILGFLVVGLAFHLLWWALIGLFIGGLGRLAVPGRQPIGLFATSAGGIAASLLGGVIAHAAHLAGWLQFVIAVAVAAVLVALLSSARRSHVRRGPTVR